MIFSYVCIFFVLKCGPYGLQFLFQAVEKWNRSSVLVSYGETLETFPSSCLMVIKKKGTMHPLFSLLIAMNR